MFRDSRDSSGADELIGPGTVPGDYISTGPWARAHGPGPLAAGSGARAPGSRTPGPPTQPLEGMSMSLDKIADVEGCFIFPIVFAGSSLVHYDRTSMKAAELCESKVWLPMSR